MISRSNFQSLRFSLTSLILTASLLFGMHAQDLTASTTSGSGATQYVLSDDSRGFDRSSTTDEPVLPFGLLVRILLFMGLGIAAWDLGRIALAQQPNQTIQARPKPSRRRLRNSRTQQAAFAGNRSPSLHVQATGFEPDHSIPERSAANPIVPDRMSSALYPKSGRTPFCHSKHDSISRAKAVEQGRSTANRGADRFGQPPELMARCMTDSARASAVIPPAAQAASNPSRRSSQFGVSEVFQKILEDNTAVLHAIEQGLVP